MQQQRRKMEEYRKCVPRYECKKVTTCLPQVIKSEKEKFI